MFLVPIFVFLIGAAIVISTILSAVRTFVVPRSTQDRLARAVFWAVRACFQVANRFAHTYKARDSIMAFYAPISLLCLVPVWLALIALGYTCMFWATGIESWFDAFKTSGSALLTLGFAPVEGLPRVGLSFTEAMLGLILVALLIAYLPTMYSAFQRRELAVTLLEVRAGKPPSAVEMIERFHRIHGFERLGEMWETWERWFADIEESHTSLAALNFFRSPTSDRSWVTAAGAVLDAAALSRSTLDIPPDPRADLCIRAGFLALRRVADFFNFPHDSNPKPTDPISITRAEFDAVCDRLTSRGVPLKPDRDQAWRDFAGWRVNYDTVLLALCIVTMAPSAPWSSDRAPEHLRTLFRQRKERDGIGK